MTWYNKAQTAFKRWKKENDFSSECTKQNIGKTILTEEFIIWPKSGGLPRFAKLKAYKEFNDAILTFDNKEITLYGK